MMRRVWMGLVGLALLGALVFGYWREARAASEGDKIDKMREKAVCLARTTNEHFWVTANVLVRHGDLMKPAICVGEEPKPYYHLVPGAWCPDCGATRVAP